MGDPAGIGPEVIAHALLNPEVQNLCSPVIIGDRAVMQEALKLCNISLSLCPVHNLSDTFPSPGMVRIIDEGQLQDFPKAGPSAEGGRAAASYIRKAVELSQAGQVDAVVTAPISKEALKLAGLKWHGHTEMLAELTGTTDYAMMLAGGPLRVILVTIHTAIKNVPQLITKENVLKTIRLAKKACDMLAITSPRIAVAGLNPHAGEAGIFGREEIEAISPAIEEAKREDLPVSGPYPPDTVFHKAYKGDIDIIVSMYHDQGLIPLKMVCFDTGVNVTIGLPIIRTSPDHGTAYDIAWKGMARPSSMIEAIRLAAKLRL